MPDPSTVLAIDLVTLSDYATRGLVQSLDYIDQARQYRRTVNGALTDVSASQFRKYRSVITGNDQVPPAFEAIRCGDQVVVDCMVELSYVTSGGSAQRTVVSGSSRTEGAFTYYRPRLTMLVTEIVLERREWEAIVSWSLSLEEV